MCTEVDSHVRVSRFRRGRVLHGDDQRDLEGAKRGQGAQVSGQGRGSSPAPAVAFRAVDCCGTGPHVQVKLGNGLRHCLEHAITTELPHPNLPLLFFFFF